MAIRGPKPTPTATKIVGGNPGKRPLAKNEPKPRRVRPSPPSFLVGAARAEWTRISDELFGMGLLTRVDRSALAAYCQAYGRWITAERAIAKMAERDPLTSGLMIKTSNGNAIQNPLVGTANKAASDMMRYAAEFGMTPSARSRISSDAHLDDDPDEAFFRKPN